jgi:hypothetical protein
MTGSPTLLPKNLVSRAKHTLQRETFRTSRLLDFCSERELVKQIGHPVDQWPLFERHGLRFTATVSRFADGRIGELFVNNHKAGNQADTNARDAAILLSFALQFGADVETIRKALCRDSQGRALGPIGAVLDLLAGSP